MAYDTNNILKGLESTKPDGATEYVSILDSVTKEIKRCLLNEFSVKTVSSFPYTVLETDSLILLNGTGTVNMIQQSAVSSSSVRKQYIFYQVSGTGTLSAFSGDSLPVTSLSAGQMLMIAGNGGTTWYDVQKVSRVHDGTAYRTASATAAANTIPVSDSSGRVDWNRPAFSAYQSASQTGLTSTIYYKVAANTEDYDTNNNYDNSTNYRFTPTVPGKYLLTGIVTLLNQSGNNILRNYLWIYKNGAQYAYASAVAGLSACVGPVGLPISIVVDANGSTDYFEIYAMVVTDSGTWAISGGNQYTRWQGTRIGI